MARRRRADKPKTLSPKVLLGQRGVDLIARVVGDMGSRWTPSNSTEVGIDGYIELFEPNTRRSTGLHLSVQSKAVTAFEGNQRTVKFRCRRKDIDDWLATNPPVILVVSRPDSDEAYWLCVAKHFAGDNNNTVATFDRARQRFVAQSYDELTDVARPKAVPPARVAAVGSERLYSNLVPLLRYPSKLFIARCTASGYPAAWARLREGHKGHVSAAWAIHGDMVVSLVDPDGGLLARIADITTLEAHDSADWAHSGDADRRRLWVQLLNGALKDDLSLAGVRYWPKDDVYAFKGHLDEPERRFTYTNVRQESTITVVSHFESKSSDGRTFPFLRHTAFRGRFRLLAGAWHLEVVPTYRFTSDGRQKYWFHEDQLRGIKTLEGNRAVLSQVLLWNHVLACAQTSLLSRRTRILRFGSVLEFMHPRVVPDSQWLPPEESEQNSTDAPLLDLIEDAGGAP